jgi:streptomycin 6-kinase
MIYNAPGDRNLSRLLTLLRRMPAFGGGQHLQQRVYVDVADLARAVLVAP